MASARLLSILYKSTCLVGMIAKGKIILATRLNTTLYANGYVWELYGA